MAGLEPSIKVESNFEDQTNNNNPNVDGGDDTVCKQEPDSDHKSSQSNADAELTSAPEATSDGILNESDDSGKTNLIVNYLPQMMTDEEFENLFKKFGSMKSCKIVRNRVSGYSYGFGFVDFQTHDQALKAIEELNGHELETKKIKVAFARPAGQDIKQANLYIKNVPGSWTQEDVKKIFEPFGNIIQVRVLGNDRGIAFVLYDLRKQAEDALEALNGKTVEGGEVPLEIKFAADKKMEKGGNKNTNNSSNNNTINTSTSNKPVKRERGNRGGRNRDNYNRNRDQHRQGRQQNRGGSFFDRQNKNYDDRSRGGGGGSSGGGGGGSNQPQYNVMPYSGGAQYMGNFDNSMNGVGPVRQGSNNRMNRFTPFIQVQRPMVATPTAAPMAAQMAPNPAFGFPAQQQMIPFAMVPAQQMTSMQPVVNQTSQMAQTSMGIPYGAPQMPIGYAPMAQNALNNIYSVASNNMNNAANMQPQIGQPMVAARSNNGSNTGTGGGDGVTLFVYNIGPDADENELRSMFGPYGQVTKCNVVRKTPGGETKGFGFVTLKDRDQASSAIAGLNGSMRNGRALQVSFKK